MTIKLMNKQKVNRPIDNYREQADGCQREEGWRDGWKI